MDGSVVEGLCGWCKTCATAYHRKNHTQKVQEGDPWKLAGEILNRMKDRTKKQGYAEPVGFTKEEIYAVINEGRCCQTGIPFRLGTTGNSQKNPFSPSPDRLDNLRGYAKDNVRWVVFIYNAMRNNFSNADVNLFINTLRNQNVTEPDHY